MPAANAPAATGQQDSAPEPLLSSGQVAALFSVDRTTVADWADKGKLSEIRTLGGHRRYREAEVRALLAERDTRQAGAA